MLKCKIHCGGMN